MEIKSLFDLSLQLNIVLNLFFIPSESNSVDFPSRAYSDLDCSLSDATWALIDASFGPHTIGLMALPSNIRNSQDGRDLKFFSPLPFKDSSGVNVFAQNLSPSENYYVFSPFVLVGSLLKFLSSQHIRVTLITPDVSPRQYRWPLLHALKVDSLRIGLKMQHNIVNFPPNTKQCWHSRPLPWDLYAFRFCF